MNSFCLTNSLIKVNDKLGECPIWNDETQKLFWIDIDRGVIHKFDPITKRLKSYNTGKKIGCIALKKDGGLVLATETGFSEWNTSVGLKSEFLHVSDPPSEIMFNDGLVDTLGNFWIGTKGPKGQSKLYILDKNNQLHEKLDGLTISNGIDWSLNGRVFYHTDSGDRAIYRYDFDQETLELSNKSEFFVPEVGTPDGLTVDSEDNLWVAIWDGWKVVQLSSKGEMISEIEVPVQRPTSVILGGEDFRTLFITSASVDLPEATLYGQQPMAGDLFAVTIDIPGKKPNRY